MPEEKRRKITMGRRSEQYVQFPRRNRANRSPGVRTDVNKLKFLPRFVSYRTLPPILGWKMPLLLWFSIQNAAAPYCSNDGLGQAVVAIFFRYPKGAVNTCVYVEGTYIIYFVQVSHSIYVLYNTISAHKEFKKKTLIKIKYRIYIIMKND